NNDEILDIVNDIIIRESVDSKSIEPQNDIQGSDDFFIINDSICVKQKPIEPQTLDPNNDEILDIVNDIIIRESVDSKSIEPQNDIQGSENVIKTHSERKHTFPRIEKRKIQCPQDFDIDHKRIRQECEFNINTLEETVQNTQNALNRCKVLLAVIYKIFISIEKVFGITLSIENIPDKANTAFENKRIFRKCENKFKQLHDALKGKYFSISIFSDGNLKYLSETAQNISKVVKYDDFVKRRWDFIANFKYKEVFNDVELKDLIILLLYQMKQTNHQFEEVKSVLLESFFVSKDIEKTKSLLIKTIILMIAGNLSNNNNPQKEDIDKINNFITKILVQHYWGKSKQEVKNYVYNVKDRLGGLKIEEQALVPLKKDNLIFYLSVLKNRQRSFKIFVYPFIKKKTTNYKNKIAPSYHTLKKTLILLTKIVDVLVNTTVIIERSK
ncbi:hypothetical protein NGRA_3308, partial [Nosema granulosis]